MNITTTKLTRTAGVSAAVAGLIFIAVQINHPHLDATTVTTTDVMVRQFAKVVMSALALIGITGMYLRQVRQAGLLGLIGYLLFGAGYLVMFSVETIGAFLLPGLAGIAPGYVNDVLTAATGGTPVGDIGRMQTLFLVNGFFYLAGGLVFGIALFRARVLARWAAVLLSIGTVATLALFALPESFNRPVAVPTGVALIGLGISLCRNARTTEDPATAEDASPSTDAATANHGPEQPAIH